jgi:hypothetical protein
MQLLTSESCLKVHTLAHDNPDRARNKGGAVRDSIHFNACITDFQRTHAY